MPEWLFLFLYLGNIHAMGMKLTEEECRDMLQVVPFEVAACVNVKKPMLRIYKEVKV